MFWKSLYATANTLAVAVTIAGTGFGAFVYFVPATKEVAAAWVLVAAGVPTVLAVHLMDALRWLAERSEPQLPRAVNALRLKEVSLLLFEPSRLFGAGMDVSIYTVEGPFEVLIGIGRVAMVQQNQMIQVVIILESAEHAEIWKRIYHNEAGALERVRARPGSVSRE